MGVLGYSGGVCVCECVGLSAIVYLVHVSCTVSACVFV